MTRSDPEERRQRRLEWRREYYRRYRKEHGQEMNAQAVARRRERIEREGYEYERQARARFAHGPSHAQAFAEMWDRQQGCCYLCGEELAGDQVVFDHDHTCCAAGRSCSTCRRGLACRRCNVLIGHVSDDPDLLRRIADNLEPVLKAARARIASKPEQLAMQDEATP